MKNQALFSSKDKSKKLKCRLMRFLFGTLRVSNYYVLFRKKKADRKGLVQRFFFFFAVLLN